MVTWIRRTGRSGSALAAKVAMATQDVIGETRDCCKMQLKEDGEGQAMGAESGRPSHVMMMVVVLLLLMLLMLLMLMLLVMMMVMMVMMVVMVMEMVMRMRMGMRMRRSIHLLMATIPATGYATKPQSPESDPIIPNPKPFKPL